ncbi:MAG: exopolysaccharide biosynthesis polyprenyl glycosylphosphotransferase [Anaerolineaceae bacterium]
MQEKASAPRWRLQPSEQRFLLILGDILSGALALFLALYLWASGDSWMQFSMEFLKTRPETWFYFLPLIWLLMLVELYDLNKAGNLAATLKGIGVAVVISTFLYLVIYFAMPPNTLPRRGTAIFIVSVAVLTLIWRLIYIRLFTAANNQRRVLIVGAGKAGSALVNVIADQKPHPFNLIGLIDDDPEKLGAEIRGFPILGDHTQMMDLIQEKGVTDLILAISGQMNHGMFQNLLLAQENGLQFATMAETYESLLGRVPITLLESDWVIRSFVERAPTSGFYQLFKRLLDLFITLVGLVILVVLFPVIGLLILIDSGRPIVYQQERLGRGGIPYSIYKFRTMKNNSDMDKESLVTSTNDPRITRLGKFLRKVHLDELPQVINVLKGEMSWVGPRSERSELVLVFQNEVPFYRARMLVKPGVTGWAQIHQPYAETVEETAVKLEYDLYYIEHASLIMDLSILLRTVGSVFGFKGR